MAASDKDRLRLDEAARVGWLYFVAGHTQQEIAEAMNVSRATAQRLVSLCLSERLITFRLEHRISSCMDLAERLKEKFALRFCDIAPSDPAAPLSTAGVAERARNLLETVLLTEEPVVVGLGTGRAVRATVEQLGALECPKHQLVSLVGNISSDGSASLFDAVGRLADLTKARHYPMPLPFLVTSEAERDRLLRIDPIAKVRKLADRTDLRLVGIGQMDRQAQVRVDGFITRDELSELMRLGAIGEIIGWAFDEEGRIIDGGTNRRLTSVPHTAPAASLTVAIALGPAKVGPIRAAMTGRLVNGLITDETTAEALLA